MITILFDKLNVTLSRENFMETWYSQLLEIYNLEMVKALVHESKGKFNLIGEMSLNLGSIEYRFEEDPQMILTLVTRHKPVFISIKEAVVESLNPLVVKVKNVRHSFHIITADWLNFSETYDQYTRPLALENSKPPLNSGIIASIDFNKKVNLIDSSSKNTSTTSMNLFEETDKTSLTVDTNDIINPVDNTHVRVRETQLALHKEDLSENDDDYYNLNLLDLTDTEVLKDIINCCYQYNMVLFREDKKFEILDCFLNERKDGLLMELKKVTESSELSVSVTGTALDFPAPASLKQLEELPRLAYICKLGKSSFSGIYDGGYFTMRGVPW